jgi:hypothetical protein
MGRGRDSLCLQSSQAHQALSADRCIGLLLPCNVLVRATDDGTIVEALDPRSIAAVAGYPELKDIAEDAAPEARGGNPHILAVAPYGREVSDTEACQSWQLCAAATIGEGRRLPGPGGWRTRATPSPAISRPGFIRMDGQARGRPVVDAAVNLPVSRTAVPP